MPPAGGPRTAAQTWQVVPVDGPSGTMHHVAALADGTLVAVGSRVMDGDFPSPAAWVSVPVASPASTAEPSVESPTPPTAPPVARAWEALGSIAVGTWNLDDMVGFDGGYVAIQRQSKAWFSTDGTTWENVTLPFKASTSGNGQPLTAYATAIATDGQRFLIVGGHASEPCRKDEPGSTGGGPACPLVPLSWVSSDGRTWTKGQPVTGLEAPPDHDQGAEFIAAWPVPTGGWDAAVSWWDGESLTGRDLLHSDDGLTWSPIAPTPAPAATTPDDLPWHHEGVADASGRRLLWMVWTSDWPPTTAVAMSDDGTTWTAVDEFPGDAADIADALAPVAGGPWLLAGQLVAGEEGQGVPAVWASPDGSAWEVIPLPVGELGPGRVTRLVREDDGYVAVGNLKDDADAAWLTAWRSSDGRTWTLIDADTPGAMDDGSLVAATGPAGTIAAVGWMASQDADRTVLRLR